MERPAVAHSLQLASLLTSAHASGPPSTGSTGCPLPLPTCQNLQSHSIGLGPPGTLLLLFVTLSGSTRDGQFNPDIGSGLVVFACGQVQITTPSGRNRPSFIWRGKEGGGVVTAITNVAATQLLWWLCETTGRQRRCRAARPQTKKKPIWRALTGAWRLQE